LELHFSNAKGNASSTSKDQASHQKTKSKKETSFKLEEDSLDDISDGETTDEADFVAMYGKNGRHNLAPQGLMTNDYRVPVSRLLTVPIHNVSSTPTNCFCSAAFEHYHYISLTTYTVKDTRQNSVA
jgi:hypothetical protein